MDNAAMKSHRKLRPRVQSGVVECAKPSHTVDVGIRLVSDLPPDRVPHIVCDACGATHPVCDERLDAYEWHLRGDPAPGWVMYAMTRQPYRIDLCPDCAYGWDAP
jgi:hypothetical protein